MCGSIKMINLKKHVNGIPPHTLIVVCIGFTFFSLFLLCCYRRHINRSLEDTLLTKIQSQTLRSISKYHKNTEKAKLNKE